ncbi:hypothetical protein Ancab_023509 [Ancistrocladus abbreviatus]
MPLEPLPWERKDFFRERKHSNHERPSSDCLGPIARWRDSSPSSSHVSGDEFGRWGFVPEFHRPPGHSKQGGWHLYHEAQAHGHPTPRSSDRFMEDDGFRPFGPRADGRYARNYRENRASLNQKDWRGHVWENNHHHNTQSNAALRQHELNDQRSVDDLVMRAFHPDSDSPNSSDRHHDKCQANKSGDVNGSVTSQRIDRESLGIDWKPLKWSRSGSLTSRGSGFSHSSSSRSIGGDLSDTKSELPLLNASAIESPSGDPFASATSAVPLEEVGSRKKPRLGWGEGLAKYEKKKVEVPDENTSKIGNAFCASNVERSHSLSSNLAERSPRIVSSSDCVSPATPSSVGCSLSPGLEDKPYGKVADIDIDAANNISVSPTLGSQIQLEGSSFNLGNLEHGLIANLNTLLSELLQSEDQSMVDSGFIKSSALNKLLLWKRDITKAVELTESKADSLENELKSLRLEGITDCPRPTSSSSLPVDCKEPPYKELNVIPRPPPLNVLSSGDIVAEQMDPCGNVVGEDHAEVREEEVDSPGTATSKYVESLALEKPISCDVQRSACSEGVANVGSVNLEANALISSTDVTRILGSSGDSIQEKDIFDHGDRYPLINSKNYAYDKILASNQEASAKAYEVFVKLLPNRDYRINVADAIRASCSENELLVRKKFLLRKRFLRFKERVISLKYRAFQHLWKEDLRLLCIRKHSARSQKKLELSSWGLQTSCLKNRSSIRSRFTSPEVISFTSKLLSDSQVKPCRNTLKMPALILDEKEKVLSRFISSNGLVEDPCAVEKERALVNPWTPEEKEIFMDKLAALGKDFRKISSFLDHKTTADCIEFYYKNHKSECFAKAKKKPEMKKQEKFLSANTYLVTAGKKWSREMNSVSLDLLGAAASAIVAHVDEGIDSMNLFSGRFSDMKSRGTDGILERSSSYEIEDEREAAAADVLAGICGSLSSEAMSSCITSSADPGEGCKEWKCQKVGSCTRQHLMPDVAQNVDDDSCSDESSGEMDLIDDWTDEEKSVFVQAFSSYGKDFAMISRCVRSKSRDQCKVFFSKAWKCLGLDILCPELVNEGTTVTNDRNGVASDTEDACVVEGGSAVCSDQFGPGMGEAMHIPISDKDHDDPNHEDVQIPISGSRVDDSLIPIPDTDHDDTNCVAVNSHSEIIGEHCGPEVKSENTPADDHWADDVSEMTLDAGIVNDEEEKSVGVQDQDDKVFSGASEAVEERTMGQDGLKAEASVNVTANVVSASAPSVLDAVMDFNVIEEVASQKPESELESNDVCTPDVPSSAKDFEGGTGKQCSIQSASSDLHQPLSGHTLMEHGESSNILKTYPFELPIQTEVNGKVSKKQLAVVDGVSRSEANFQSLKNCYLKKCSHIASQDLITELNFLPESGVQSKVMGSHVPCLSDIEKPCGNGDVKLFGQILSKPSSSMPNSPLPSVKENEYKGVQHPSLASMHDMKPSPTNNMNGNLALPRYDHADYLGLDNFPVRSYGFWDGTRIRTGYASLTDSAMLLAKYPAAFSNHALPSSKIERQTMNTNECNLNSVSVLPARESCSNGVVTDHQACRNQDSMHPFRLKMKQRHDVLAEMQRNGLEAVSNSQQHQGRGNGFVKLNVVQVDSSYCGGISDPVAALKLHYAKAQAAAATAGNGNGNVIREEESWRGQ